MEPDGVVDGFVGHLKKLDEAKTIHLDSLKELAVEEREIRDEILLAEETIKHTELEKLKLDAALNNIKGEVFILNMEIEKCLHEVEHLEEKCARMQTREIRIREHDKRFSESLRD